MTDRTAFRFDCGATWLNLLATRGSHFGEHPVERLPTVERLAEWLERVELTPKHAVDQDDLELTWRLRETLRPLALCTVDGTAPDPAVVDALSTFLAPDPMALLVNARLSMRPPASAAEALGRIARQAVDQLTGPDRSNLFACSEADCRGVFLDTTGRRRWCPNPTCATRGRVRAHRARKAQST